MYTPKNYDNLLGTPGFSDNMLKTHFGLYQGYVKNTNTLIEKLRGAAKTRNLSGPEYAEMKRRFGWEWNGVRLHELYFENMTKETSKFDENSKLAKKLSEAFGAYDNWLQDFKATGTMRGIGWTILYHDTHENKLFNAWVSEHDMGHLAGAKPLLVLDVFEHAYVFDYGMKRNEYIEAFLNAVNWEVVNSRLTEK